MYAACPLHARSLFLFVTGATPGGTMGRLSTTECTYPTLSRTSSAACFGIDTNDGTAV